MNPIELDLSLDTDLDAITSPINFNNEVQAPIVIDPIPFSDSVINPDPIDNLIGSLPVDPDPIGTLINSLPEYPDPIGTQSPPSVTINIVGRGTPTTDGQGNNSTAGHMWYSLTDSNGIVSSYGFSPISSTPIGAGGINVHGSDNDYYQGDRYSKTIEITQSQYDEMKRFGDDPAAGGFRLNYNALTNSCVDFVWKGLEKIGLNPTGFEGYVIPTDNIDIIKDLVNPTPPIIVIDPPVDPINPVDPPVDPINPVDPPVDPINPVDPPVDPINPVDPPVDPINPVDPPVDPINPVDPPVDPINPVDPPVDPINPVDPPVDPINPIDPPVDPIYPVDPPVDPIYPVDPPVDPIYPVDPPVDPIYPVDPPFDPGFFDPPFDPGFFDPSFDPGFFDPVVLDLTGNGFNLLDVETSSAHFDILGGGKQYQTGWAGEGNGLLAYDVDNDSLINHRSEIAFIDYKPGAKTDLEGLTAFDTNQNGWFEKTDDKWNQFGVWEDKNVDGITDQGEYRSLDSLGIQSIYLTSDHQQSFMNGNTIHGVTQVVMQNGSSLLAADVSFNVSNQILI
jgi:hypothetical protein